MNTITFPTNPNNGDRYTFANKTWQWDSAGWFIVAVTAGGSNTQVQYNNNGTLGGVTNLTTDGTNVIAFTMAGARALFSASAAGYASINLPHGTAPSAPANGDVWTTTAGIYARINGGTVGPFSAGGLPGGSSSQLQFNNAGAFGGIANVTSDGTNLTAITVSGAKTNLAASAAGYASMNAPHGTAPSSPSNGDIWTTTAGLYARINGVTVGPYGSGNGNAYQDVILADAPYRYYRLNETAGTTATDSSSSAVNGTYAGSGVTYNQTSLLYSGGGAAALFDGTAGEMTYNLTLNSLSSGAMLIVEGVVNLTGSSLKGAFAYIHVNGRRFGIGVGLADMTANGNNLIGLQENFAWFVGAPMGTGNKHFALAYHPAQALILLFLDGICVLTGSTGTPGALAETTSSFGASNGSRFFPGKIQEGAVFYYIDVINDASYFRALASQIVRRHYQAFKRGV